MEFRGFEDLEVYRLSERLSDRAWELVRAWPILARDTVGKQLIRAADSVGANIAEGSGRGTFKDNCRFIDNARGSLYETRHWLRRAFQRNLLDESTVSEIKKIIDELSPRLNAYRNSLKQRDRLPKRTNKSK